MTSLTAPRSPGPIAFTGARIAVLGYDADARDCARALARGGNRVTIGLEHGGTCWSRAHDDGFAVAGAAAAVDRAGVIVIVVRDPEPAWRASRPYIEPGALVVVSSAFALETGMFDGAPTDVVLVTAIQLRPDQRVSPCRIAVHRDVTGRALLRGISYVHAVFGTDMPIDATTLTTEIDRELAGVAERAGSVLAVARAHDPISDDRERVSVNDLLGPARGLA
jgi:ketol-acid reductoisomerase